MSHQPKLGESKKAAYKSAHWIFFEVEMTGGGPRWDSNVMWPEDDEPPEPMVGDEREDPEKAPIRPEMAGAEAAEEAAESDPAPTAVGVGGEENELSDSKKASGEKGRHRGGASKAEMDLASGRRDEKYRSSGMRKAEVRSAK